MDLYKVFGYPLAPRKGNRVGAKAEEFFSNENEAKRYAKSWREKGKCTEKASVHIYKYIGVGKGTYEFSGEICF